MSSLIVEGVTLNVFSVILTVEVFCSALFGIKTETKLEKKLLFFLVFCFFFSCF